MLSHVVVLWRGYFLAISTLADYLGIMSGVSFVMWWRTKDKKYLYLIAWFLLSTIVGSIRTGILVILVVMVLHRICAIGVITSLYWRHSTFCITGCHIYSTSQRKMFYDRQSHLLAIYPQSLLTTSIVTVDLPCGNGHWKILCRP